jgi:hypothetical protein
MTCCSTRQPPVERARQAQSRLVIDLDVGVVDCPEGRLRRPE